MKPVTPKNGLVLLVGTDQMGLKPLRGCWTGFWKKTDQTYSRATKRVMRWGMKGFTGHEGGEGDQTTWGNPAAFGRVETKKEILGITLVVSTFWGKGT